MGDTHRRKDHLVRVRVKGVWSHVKSEIKVRVSNALKGILFESKG